MPFDPVTGIYSVPPGSTAVAGTVIDPVMWNALMDDLETSLSQAALRIGGPFVMTTDLNMGGYRVVSMAPGTASSDGVRVDQVFPMLSSKWNAPAEDSISGDLVMTSDWANLSSNLVSIGGAAVPPKLITRFGAAGAAFDGPYFIRFTDNTCTLVHSASLVCPGEQNLETEAGMGIILMPFSTVNGTTPNAYRVILL